MMTTTSAPKSMKVSIKTAVCIVIWIQPIILGAFEWLFIFIFFLDKTLNHQKSRRHFIFCASKIFLVGQTLPDDVHALSPALNFTLHSLNSLFPLKWQNSNLSMISSLSQKLKNSSPY